MNIRTVVATALVAVACVGPLSASQVELLPRPEGSVALYSFRGTLVPGALGRYTLHLYCVTGNTPYGNTASAYFHKIASLNAMSPDAEIVTQTYDYGVYPGSVTLITKASDRGKTLEFTGTLLCNYPGGSDGQKYPYHTVGAQAVHSGFGDIAWAGEQTMNLTPAFSTTLINIGSELLPTAVGVGSVTLDVLDSLTLVGGESKTVLRHIHGSGRAMVHLDTSGVAGLRCQFAGSDAIATQSMGQGDSVVCRNESGQKGVTEGTLNIIAAIR